MRGGALYFPALCERCAQVVALNLAHAPWRCPQCDSPDVVPYFLEETDGDQMIEIIGTRCGLTLSDGSDLEFSLYEDATYTCPACHQVTLRFEHEGHWD
jgi:Zn finger protein HypA/HybF involved in hydrogenase expression